MRTRNNYPWTQPPTKKQKLNQSSLSSHEDDDDDFEVVPMEAYKHDVDAVIDDDDDDDIDINDFLELAHQQDDDDDDDTFDTDDDDAVEEDPHPSTTSTSTAMNSIFTKKPKSIAPQTDTLTTSSSALKIKLATPAKGKHKEYNLKTLQESIVESQALSQALAASSESTDDLHTADDTSGIAPQTQDIICSASEWHKLGPIHARLLQHITVDMQLAHPTIIQRQAIPHLLQNRDALIKSETGSGKTFAYLIPIVSDLCSELTARGDGCKAMVIAPTRELSLQIHQVLTVLCRKTSFLVFGVLMGGEAKANEKARLRKGLSIVIGTPGRVLDHLENTQSFKFDLLRWLVLDEADILLNLGFEKFIRSIVRMVSQRSSVMQRCNVLVSATLDQRVHRLAQFVLDKHVFISLNEGGDSNAKVGVGDGDEDGKTVGDGNMDDATYIPATLKHSFLNVRREHKSMALIGVLRMLYAQQRSEQKRSKKSKSGSSSDGDSFKVIIFMSTCRVVEFFYALLRDCRLFPHSSQRVLPAPMAWYHLHGDMSQKERTQTYFAFCNENNGVLLCTDVASRGLDIPKVTVIVQYDPPSNLQDYIHRSGRTARMGRAGQTILFVTPKENGYLDILKAKKFTFTKINNAHVWNQLDVDFERHKIQRKYQKVMAQDEEAGQTHSDGARQTIYRHIKLWVSAQPELKEKAHNAMQTFVKAYTTYPRQMKSIFFIQNLDFQQVSACFFVDRDRDAKFMKKGGMKEDIRKNKYFRKRDDMKHTARRMGQPLNVSEFGA